MVRVPRRRSQSLPAAPRQQARAPFRPGASLAAGFAGLITVGTILLLLPVAHEPGRSTDFVTALFTATSAVCVTGLTVVVTSEHWSTFGQAVILALVQIGALGFVTGAIVILTLVGRRTSSRERMLFGQPLGLREPGGLIGLVWRIALLTLAVEAVGFGLLYWRIAPDPSVENPVWWAVFHSISAFTNAGFDIESGGQSLARLLEDSTTLTIFMALFLVGGLGFTVIFDLIRRRRWRKLSLESRLVLSTIPALLAFGFVSMLILTPEFGGAVAENDIGTRATSAAFHTVSRTAGFRTVDMGTLPVDTLVMVMVLMFIGGASASVAGGITVNTFGVLVVSTLSHIRGRRIPEAFGRTIANATVMRALAVTLLSAAAVVLATIFMSIAERESGHELSNLLFEAVSAFAVVGYSTGVTADLTAVSKIILVLTMFTGRLGALTLAQALVTRERQVLVKYPEETIKIG